MSSLTPVASASSVEAMAECSGAPTRNADYLRSQLQPSRHVRVTISTLGGRAYNLVADRDDSVISLKRQMCSTCCVDPWQLRLLPSGSHTMPEDYDSIGTTLPADEDELRLTLVILQQLPDQILTNTQQLVKFLHSTGPRPAVPSDYYGRAGRACSVLTRGRHWPFPRHRGLLAWPGWKGHFGGHTKAVRKQKSRGTRPQQEALQKAALKAQAPRPRSVKESPAPCAHLWRPRSLGITTELKAEVAQGHVNFSQVSQGSLLHMALTKLCGPGLLELCRLLLAGGARVSIPDVAGWQPLHLACSLGRGEVALLLLRHKAEVTARTRRGQTPLDCAIEYFRQCPYHNNEVPEVLALAKACCQLSHGGAPPRGAAAPESLAGLRRRLAGAATGLALLKPFGGRVTKDEVVSSSALPREALAGMGSELWEGWPRAFLVLGQSADGPSDAAAWFEDGFVQARQGVLRSTAAARPDVAAPRIARSSSVSTVSDSDGEGLPQWSEYEETKLLRSRAWALSSRGPARRVRRVPWPAGQSRRASRSSRLARQLPAAASGRAPGAWRRRCGGGGGARGGRAAAARAAWTDWRDDPYLWAGP